MKGTEMEGTGSNRGEEGSSEIQTGWDIPKGWVPVVEWLVEEVARRLQSEGLDPNGPYFEVRGARKVNEGLEIRYWTQLEFGGLVDHFQELANEVCEYCGEQATRRGASGLPAACDEHC